MTDAQLPEGPTGVWLEYPDGVIYENVPTVYVGTNEEGVALFDLILPRDEPALRAGAKLWPGMTAMSIPILRKGTHEQDAEHHPERTDG